MKQTASIRYKMVCLIYSALFCSISVLSVLIYEFNILFTNEIADKIYVCAIIICPFHIFADSIALGISTRYTLKVDVAWLRILIDFALWSVVVVSVFFTKRIKKLRELIVKLLLCIDICLHALFIIGGVMHLSSLWGMMLVGIMAVFIDVITLIIALKALNSAVSTGDGLRGTRGRFA